MFSWIKKWVDTMHDKEKKKEKYMQDRIKSFNDPIAWKTNFDSLVGWWSNIQTHTLQYDAFWNIVFKQHVLLWFIFLSVFLWVGWSILLPHLWDIIIHAEDIHIIDIYSMGAWILFIIIWIIVFYLSTQNSKIFDFQNGYFYPLRYKKKFWENIHNNRIKGKIAKISDIYALQIIKKRVRSNRDIYDSYELNIVLKNTDRINVINHGVSYIIREDAQEIVDKLRVPVWDVSGI